MHEPEPPLPEIYIQPGESRIVERPSILCTVLGSCVGITFWVPRLDIGALCHPMLPQCPVAKRGTRAGLRYVDYAIQNMAQKLDSRGSLRREVRVKLFGGCDVLPMIGGERRPTVGKLNSEVAVRVLEEEGFTISAARLRGGSGIHIQFDTGNGEVLLRELPSHILPDEVEPINTVHRSGERQSVPQGNHHERK
jgi:chemotaxis protein CheD